MENDVCGLFHRKGKLMQLYIHSPNHLHYSCTIYLLAVVVIYFSQLQHISVLCPLVYYLGRLGQPLPVGAVPALPKVIKDRNRTSTENGCNVNESIRIVEQGHTSYNHHHHTEPDVGPGRA